MNTKEFVEAHPIFAVNKPKGLNSHNVVSLVRRLTGIRRVGHGGTLDPLASGVLVIAVGRENTKQLDRYVKGEKEYIAQITLGFHSTTDDLEGKLISENPDHIPTSKDVENVVKSFVGHVTQLPPMYSSLKINGSPAHRIARRREKSNKEVINTLKPRVVFIESIQILSYEYPILEIKVITGPGVYIRAVARDIGKSLGTGGYLSDLTRTRVNTFTIENALDVDVLKEDLT